MSIRVDIDRLVLEGIALAPGDVAEVKAALEGELARLMRRDAAPDGRTPSGDLAEVRGGTIEVPSGTTSNGLGRRVARAVHRAIPMRAPTEGRRGGTA